MGCLSDKPKSNKKTDIYKDNNDGVPSEGKANIQNNENPTKNGIQADS